VEPGQPVWLTYWLDGVKTIQGKISSVNANGTFLHDIPTEPGMSGSVIWDEFGRIAGIHKAADSAPYNKAVWLNAAMILKAGQMALPKNFQPRNIK
jgi:V8-like Glu-specific endopeptidase